MSNDPYPIGEVPQHKVYQVRDLTFSETLLCPCGALLATTADLRVWCCSAKLLGHADEERQHKTSVPFGRLTSHVR